MRARRIMLRYTYARRDWLHHIGTAGGGAGIGGGNAHERRQLKHRMPARAPAVQT